MPMRCATQSLHCPLSVAFVPRAAIQIIRAVQAAREAAAVAVLNVVAIEHVVAVFAMIHRLRISHLIYTYIICIINA